MSDILFGGESEKYVQELKRRYKECDSGEHRDVVDGRCGYCYRRLEIPTPEYDDLIFHEGEISFMKKLFIAPVVAETLERELELGKARDGLYGLRMIQEELERKVEE